MKLNSIGIILLGFGVLMETLGLVCPPFILE